MRCLILVIDLHIHALWLLLVMMVSVLGSLFFRQIQLKKARKQILYLENEMMNNHAEILRLQRELATEKSSKTNTPVVPLKEQPTEKADQSDIVLPHRKSKS